MDNSKKLELGSGFLRPVDTSNPKYNLPKDMFYKYFKKGLESEKDLCKFNKEYLKFVDKYKSKIEKHLENLGNIDKALGDNIENTSFNGFCESFEILGTNNTFEDDLQPLLLKNYIYMGEYDNGSNIIEYHLEQQLYYLIFNYYNEEEQRMFGSFIFKNIMTEPEFQVISSDGQLTDFLPLYHTNYQLDYVKIKKILDQVIAFLKKSEETKLFESEPALLTTLPNPKTEKSEETLIKEVLCNQTRVDSTKKISKKIKLIKPKQIKQSKPSKQSKKVSKHLKSSTKSYKLKSTKVHMSQKVVIPIDIKPQAEQLPKNIVEKKRDSKKISQKVIQIKETLTPPLEEQITNHVPINAKEERKIQDIQLPKNIGLPAFKIELPEKKPMIPFEKKPMIPYEKKQ